MKELIEKLKSIMAVASPLPWESRANTSDGLQLRAPMPRSNHVEYTLKEGDRTIMNQGRYALYNYGGEEPGKVGYEPWVQFSSTDYVNLMKNNYQLIQEAVNNLPVLMSRIEELEKQLAESKK